jgi:hypothetical protein
MNSLRGFAAIFALTLTVLAGSLSAPVAAQARRGLGRQEPPADGSVSPAEIQQLFDTMVMMQAQQELRLSDEQFLQFMPRVRALQAARRRAQNERNRVLMELRRLTQPNDSKSDEAQIKERLRMLDDVDTRSAAEIRQALSGIDQLLDVRQQARFRLLEEMVERRKAELVMRARQGRGRGQF